MKGFLDRLKTESVKSRNLGLYWEKYCFVVSEGEDKSKAAFKILDHLVSIQKKDYLDIQKMMEERRDEVIKTIGKDRVLCDLKATLDINSKLLIGAGNTSYLEVGMTFSRNYGVPIIPATALKGAFSHYIKENRDSISFNGDFNQIFKYYFGEDVEKAEENTRGALIFLDAIPSPETGLEFGVDIVNNHFSPYYSDHDNPPNDWYNPMPVIYIVVKRAKFRFTILFDKPPSDNRNREILIQKFKEMLGNYGIGAKTNYGYGLFKIG